SDTWRRRRGAAHGGLAEAGLEIDLRLLFVGHRAPKGGCERVRNDPVGRGACPDRAVLQKARVTILFSVGLRRIAKMAEPTVGGGVPRRERAVARVLRAARPSAAEMESVHVSRMNRSMASPWRPRPGRRRRAYGVGAHIVLPRQGNR